MQIFSFKKQPSSVLFKKTIRDIKNYRNEVFPHGWYFNANLLEDPKPILIDEEIRINLSVCQIGNFLERVTLVLTENLVRKYVNILKANKNYTFFDGTIKGQSQGLMNILMAQKASLKLLQICQMPKMQQKEDQNSKIQFVVAPATGKQTKSYKNMSCRIPNAIKQVINTSISNLKLNIPSQKNYHPNSYQRIHKSQKVNNHTMSTMHTNNPQTSNRSKQQFVDLFGSIICRYEIGRGKLNHGIGYLIEDLHTCERSQVVIWSESRSVDLIKGKTYEFRNFKANKKFNYKISYHSHFYFSEIYEVT